MKAAKGSTSKHAGTAKHVVAAKHKPSAAQAAAVAKAKAAAMAKVAKQRVVAKQAAHAKPQKATWSPNLDVACCAAEALAVSLRLTGRAVSDQDVLDLYWRTTSDPEGGATLWETFEAAAAYGIGGVQLLDARPAGLAETGVILGVDLAQRHAMTIDEHGVWTWGQWRPLSDGLLAAADEAWVITWP